MFSIPRGSAPGLFIFLLDDKFGYEVFENETKIAAFETKVKMAYDGSLYFESGTGRLYFGKRDGTFYFYRVDGNDRFLKMFFAALPSIPLSYRDGMTWTDFIPAGTTAVGIRKIIAHVGSSFCHSVARVQSTLRFTGVNTISSVIESGILCLNKTAEVEIGPDKGIKFIKTGRIIIRRKENENNEN